jgi:hypothetical protein
MAAMVTLDLIDAPRSLVDAVRARVDADGFLPGSSVMISATHAHTGPVPGRFLRTPDAPDASATGPDSPHGKYLAALPNLIAAAVRNAAAAGLGGLCWQAGGVICLDLPACQAEAEALGLFLWAR